MTPIVVDASVAVKWVVGEAHSDRAALLRDAPSLYAPDHWLAEAVNALWAKAARGDMTGSEAGARARLLVLAPVRGVKLSELCPAALDLSVAIGVTVSDSLYIVLAQRLAAMFVTADLRLVRRVRETPLPAGLIGWVGDYQGPAAFSP